jgi:hypothetical protein
MFVLGMGEQKTPRSFISACNKFSYLDILYAAANSEKAAQQQAAPEGRAVVKKQTEAKQSVQEVDEKAGSNIKTIKQALRELAEENSDDDGWIFSGKLGGFSSSSSPTLTSAIWKQEICPVCHVPRYF